MTIAATSMSAGSRATLRPLSDAYNQQQGILRFLQQYLTKADITDANSSKVKRPPSEAARNERSVLNVSPLCGGA
jgi:hypothetical protein